jgi:hypothetical protein
MEHEMTWPTRRTIGPYIGIDGGPRQSPAYQGPHSAGKNSFGVATSLVGCDTATPAPKAGFNHDLLKPIDAAALRELLTS